MERAREQAVLIVEQDSATGSLIGDILSDEGYFTTVLGNGNAALEMLVDFRPNLILLGLSLPGLSGEQVLSLVRAQPSTTAIAVVVMAARKTVPPLVEAKATAVLAKPFEIDELLTVVAQVLAAPMENELGS